MQRKLKSGIINGYVELHQDCESPLSFVRWSAISMIATAARRKCCLKWGLETLYPNFYIALVGPSACRKTTSMIAAKILIESIGIRLVADAITREKLIQRFNEVTDISNREDGVIVTHSSLTLFSSELAVFIGYGNTKFITELCDWYDCGDVWRNETKHQGDEEIHGVYFNLLGCTTPETLQAVMPYEVIGTGLPSRFIFVFEEKKGKHIANPFFPMTDTGKDLIADIAHDLSIVRDVQGDFTIHPSYNALYTEWYNSMKGKECQFVDKRFEGYWGRRATHLKKLSMIMSLDKKDDLTLDALDFENAYKELIAVEQKMSYTFKGIGKNIDAYIIKQLIIWFNYKPLLTESEIISRFITDVPESRIQQILMTMYKMGNLNINSTSQGKTYSFVWSSNEFTM